MINYMNYRINQKNNDKLSILGFGCMRFAKSKEEVEKQIIHAIENGVNYFDTAYIYIQTVRLHWEVCLQKAIVIVLKFQQKCHPI